jgi:hypothetical protein
MGIKSSNFKMSSGDEPSRPTGGGVVTHNVQGKAYFQSFAMNVMIDGEPAVRHLDLVTHNHMGPQPGNTPPAPWLSTMAMATAPADSATNDQQKGHDWIEIKVVDKAGRSVPNVRYKLELTDDSVVEGRTPGGGVVRVQGIDKGNCKLTFPELQKHRRR